MNLITFGFSEKGTPVFLNQEPYPQVGTLYLMKAGKNSVIGITLDDSLLRPTKIAGRKSRKVKTTEGAEPKKRGRKPKAAAIEAAPAKRGRKSKAEVTETAAKKKVRKPGKPRVTKEKTVKKETVEKKEHGAV